MPPLLFAALGDGSLWTIITHPLAVALLAYGVPTAVLLAVKLFLPSIDLTFLLKPLSWMLSADASSNAALAADVAEMKAAVAAIKAATVQPVKPAV